MRTPRLFHLSTRIARDDSPARAVPAPASWPFAPPRVMSSPPACCPFCRQTPDAAARICTVCIARAGVALQAAGDGWQCDGAPSPDRCQWAVDPRLMSCSRPSLSTPPRPVCDVRISLPTASPACIQLCFVGACVAFRDGAIAAT